MIGPRWMWITAAGVLAGGVVGLAGGAVGHTVSPRTVVHTTVVTQPPNTVTATATATQIVVETKPVVVPSPVLVTVTSQPATTQYEAQAYCTQLAAQAWPYAPATGDPITDQMTAAYANLQRGRTQKQCMADHGY